VLSIDFDLLEAPTAIFSFLRNPHSFEEAVRYAISLGGDTDTIGAWLGQSAVHSMGRSHFREWKSKLEALDCIEMLGENLWKIKLKDVFCGFLWLKKSGVRVRMHAPIYVCRNSNKQSWLVDLGVGYQN